MRTVWRVGQTIVNVPDATIIELYVDDEPLFLPTARTPEYLRVLDMRNGVLTRDLVWATPSGKHACSQHTARFLRAPSCGRRLLRGDHGRARASDHPLTRRQPGESVAEGAEAEGARNDPRLGTRLGRRVLDALLVEQEGERLVLGYQTLKVG